MPNDGDIVHISHDSRLTKLFAQEGQISDGDAHMGLSFF